MANRPRPVTAAVEPVGMWLCVCVHVCVHVHTWEYKHPWLLSSCVLGMCSGGKKFHVSEGGDYLPAWVLRSTWGLSWGAKGKEALGNGVCPAGYGQISLRKSYVWMSVYAQQCHSNV
jgi:hypothetical protein